MDTGTETITRFSLSNAENNPLETIHLLEKDSALIKTGFTIKDSFGTIQFDWQSTAASNGNVNSTSRGCF